MFFRTLSIVFLLALGVLFADIQVKTSSEFSVTGVSNTTDNSYTPLWTFAGSTYYVWQDASRRPFVTKVSGSIQSTVPLDPNEDYTALNDGHHKFSMGIDKDGYIHITGDMHNYPGATDHMPARYKNKIIMYWVSKSPANISDGFEFVGGNADRAINGHTFSYGAFYADKYGELYYFTRMRAIKTNPPSHFGGEMGVGLYRYDAIQKKWSARGANAPLVKSGADYFKTVFWEDTGIIGWYQGFRGTIRFDDSNRMHFSVAAATHPDFGTSHVLYAWSDDGGQSFFRAEGDAIPLPMRAKSGPSQASVVDHSGGTAMEFDLHTGVFFDKDGNPGITYKRSTESSGEYKYFNKVQNSWSPRIKSSVGASIREMHFLHPSGKLIFINNGTGKIEVSDGFGQSGTIFNTGYQLRSIDEYGLRRTGVLRAVGDKDGKHHIVKVELSGSDIPAMSSSSSIPQSSSSAVGVDIVLGLFDTQTNSALAEDLSAIDTLNFSSLNSLSVVATPNGVVASIQFDWNGVLNYRTENVAPYALEGDVNGSLLNPVPFEVGRQVIRVTAFNEQGVELGRSEVEFWLLIDGVTSTWIEPGQGRSLNMEGRNLRFNVQGQRMQNKIDCHRCLSVKEAGFGGLGTKKISAD
jgi:hypothetical protein